VAFPQLFTPRAADAEIDPGKYTCMVLIPKTDEKTVNAIKDGIKSELAAKFKKEPIDWGNPLKDGDKYFNSLDDEKAEGKEYYKGHYYLNLKSSNQPKVQDQYGKTATDPKSIESGDFIRVAFNLSAYDTAGNKGVGAYVQTVQFAKKGDSIGGGSIVFDALEEEDDEAFA
jgi:hypothetical protein